MSELPHNQIIHKIQLPENVVAAYTEPHRVYHNIDHLQYMIHNLRTLYSDLPKDVFDATLWAIMYHDIVYNIPSKKQTNEELSSDLFIAEHGDHSLVVEIAQAIRCTEGHQLDFEYSIKNEIAEKMGRPTPAWTIVSTLIDLDLWALSDEELYLENNDKIKLENNASDEQWVVGRSNWLEAFLQRDKIYYTTLGKTREAEARRILQADLDNLNSLK
jgi:predicted metal-dependent HD superfamily phosphohydrolase